MNKTEFTDLIINPDKLGNEHIDTLRKIVADYPYFSTAQILLAKALLNTHHYEYDKQLKTTALSILNREVLHQFLNNQPIEIEQENSLMRVSNELKAEKVSRPDFEIGKEEQEALLNEAQNIISNHEISTFETETIIENTTDFIEEKIENSTDNFDFSEPILEEIVNEIQATENEINVPIETEHILENTSDFIKEKVENSADNFDFSEPILEEIVNEIQATENEINVPIETETILENTTDFITEKVENSADNFDFSEPILEEIVNEIPAIEEDIKVPIETENFLENTTDFIPEEVENNEAENAEIDFHLVETEGTLVRFVNAEVFLPNFDESSLFTDEQNIETITKSVLPNSINNNVSTIEIEEKSDTLNNSEIFENNDKVEPNEELIISDEPISESFIADSVEENSLVSNVVVEKDIETLENILDSNNTSENIDNHTENVIENSVEFENEIETVEDNIDEIQVALTNDFAESEAIIEANNLNFFEWLKANRKESVEEIAETAKPQEIKNYEDTAFVDKIKQIIKSKSELDLKNNITTGIEKAHDGIVPFERKNTLPESIEETVESIELDKNIIEEMNIEMIANANIDLYTDNISENESINNELEQPENFSNNEIYSSRVESILPDFEALKLLENKEEQPYIIFDKKEGLIPKYETPAFDPLFNSNYETKVPATEQNNYSEKAPLVDLNEEEVVNFDDFKIDNNLFEKSFVEVYIPLPQIETKQAIEKSQIVESKNDETDASKNEIENILDKFMRENPSISRPKTEFFNPITVAKSSAEEKDEIVSETLASIYLKQGLVKKSISTYEKLCLIYPLKNAYFAALINKIKIEHNIN